jgi:SAM-dependent methyltransferase
LEFGCGLGQDSRNLAKLAGFSVTSVDVSASAIEEAKNFTPQEMQGSGPSQINFVAYDAFGLPSPLKRVDFFFDATVYCGLRSSYLARAYEVWSRIFTPGHTLVSIQCWASEPDQPQRIGKARRDMEADFEPLFDILHSEPCEKNQGGAGWCFYMKLKSQSVRDGIAQERLQLQHAARDGDITFLSKQLESRPNGNSSVAEAEFWTLKYIAEANGHPWTLQPKERTDKYWQLAYGHDSEDMEAIDEEDLMDAQDSPTAQLEVARLKADWERAEMGELAFRHVILSSHAAPSWPDAK